MKNEILRMDQVTTFQDGLTMLDHFNLHIFKGEIMGLVCLNENGKESLIRLIRQNAPIHYGRVYFDETLVNNYQHSPMTPNRVAVIEQKSRLVEDLTVSDNIFVLRRGVKKFVISRRVLNEQLRLFTSRLGIAVSGGDLVANLSRYEKCIVELLRALMMGEKLVVVRDISNSVSAADLINLHCLLRLFCLNGLSVLYICSHHEEAFKICDRISLMRDGKILKVLDRGEFLPENMLPFYSKSFDNLPKKEPVSRTGEEFLSFRDVRTETMDGMSFSVAKGECTVLLDIDNTVLRDIMALMNGSLKPESGEIIFCGASYTQRMARRAAANGVAFIDENPAKSMIFKDMSYLENLCFLIGEKQNRLPVGKRMKRHIEKEYAALVGNDIYEPNVKGLSLPSLYDLVYYRTVLGNPKIVFCMQPFAGADMYLRRHLIDLIGLMKRKGITVVMPSVNLADSMVIADRLILLKKGRFSQEYDRDEFYLFRSEGIIL
ncbi:Ribose import ATP-binding protein RbsA [Caprobacter fermentans]|uniref:Ribose import ATP-binding protein RbsA n=1 Tax=Caproicibacter fermentans TaxID=2576756 RepID=A0A6N8I4Q6_9FIRM|nr:ATP-binding cassette domain-containing protein [Caproicibacter fermentans]MVB13111.1 Ribose import ATP-binding protein RbsA [Caproicibacter fermentans]